jgi:ABC-type transporter Mla MlaB component
MSVLLHFMRCCQAVNQFSSLRVTITRTNKTPVKIYNLQETSLILEASFTLKR